jgi:two-component system response regulator YesN
MIFHKETGKTVTDYIRETRIEAAKRILLTTALKVCRVSEKVGNRSVEHFSRVRDDRKRRPEGRRV